MFLKTLTVTVAVVNLLFTSSVNAETQSTVSDGPYIHYGKDTLEATWICNNLVVKSSFKHDQATQEIAHCDLAAVINKTNFDLPIIEYKGDFKIAAMSDFHGQYALTTKILKANNIIDESLNWAFGNGHFVITGDVFDRGDKVTELLWLLYKLEQQAEQAGGKLHLLLGNHEVMVLNGDLRYLHPKYHTVSELLDVDFNELFSNETILGRWLRSKPVLVKINNMIFAHGGFHPTIATKDKSLNEINETFKDNLVKTELASERAGFGKFLHKTNGPIWYRGYFKDDGATDDEINLLLTHFDVSHLVVGHTSQQQIETRYQGKVIAIDSSIKNGQYGEILLVNKNSFMRGTPEGKKVPLALSAL
ncbi:metallophosphoesterase [Thalassotalea eurytherma]|uniref:Metallophosphoesterase n=1 Tax=Thalassotalea eurytherma TaxID=1144278 RepID=A0ABQ6H0Y9_9GAMM|nr:metallophosphoesterase [Thalassotalea eurytherma]GLX81868.1 metallophosphoesterase [Thalassotalea eurytherma]